MRVLHIAHTDTLGGAARAAYRLHTALRSAGVDSRMLVGWKRSDDPSVYAWGTRTEHRLRAYGDRLLTMLAGGRWASSWSNNRFPRSPYAFADGWTPEVVNLHWVWGGFARLRDLHLWSVPQVWTMHDMAALTGGCHYAGSCARFTHQCGACPQLCSRREADRSTVIQSERIEFARRLRPVVVAPSHWTSTVASKSAAYRGLRPAMIPNGFSLKSFCAKDRTAARARLGLSPHVPIVAFGAIGATTDSRKGEDLLRSALACLRKRRGSGFEVMVFGARQAGVVEQFGYRQVCLAHINNDDVLADAYSAADGFVAPSRQEVGPLTLAESLACGTPGVGFRIGGVPDILDHQETGWIAEPYDCEDLARGISWCLDHPDPEALRLRCRAMAESRFAIEMQAQRYADLYEELLAQ